jgi:glycosyltransferase involved in cell wall biosynthesis
MKNNMRIAIVSIYSFPKGLAPTSRILAYSKGMVDAGVSIDVIIPFPTDNSVGIELNDVNNGSYEGIKFYFTSGRYKSKYKIFRAISIISGYRKLCGYYTSIKRIMLLSINDKYKCIIISNDSISMLFIYSVLSKLLKVDSIFIFDEFPIPIRHRLKKKIPIWKEILYRIVLRNITAYISISDKLKNYYNDYCLHKTFLLPIIVDVTRFNYAKRQINTSNNPEYLCYMGNMELTKDNVDNIIKSFSLISNNFPSLMLFLYGSPTDNNERKLNNLILSLKLNNRVFLKGKVNNSQVPGILMNSRVLLSSQPNTIRASGGFPTKLGEYLATGVPSLLTDVGENSRYVQDNVHIFFSKPDDSSAYSEKLSFILNNYEYSLKIANFGKQYLLENYSHIKIGKNLIEFIHSI